MPAALKGSEAAQLTEPKEIRRMLTNLRLALAWDERIKGSAAKEIRHLVKLAREYSRSSP